MKENKVKTAYMGAVLLLLFTGESFSSFLFSFIKVLMSRVGQQFALITYHKFHNRNRIGAYSRLSIFFFVFANNSW